MANVTRVRSRGSTSSGVSQDLKKGEYGYPSGHLGHLTAQQEEALHDFKQLLRNKDLLTTDEETGKPSHDDVVLLRFLRARRFVPRDAFYQFADTEKWRKTNEIANLYLNIDAEEYYETWKLYPQWTGRRDKRGLPVYVFEVAPLNAKRMAEYAKNATKTTVLNSQRDQKGKDAVPPKLYRLFALYENLTNFIMPLCTELRDRPVSSTPISQANNIVDISNVGLKQFWNLRGHMQDASVLATAHYPETLDRIFIVGAPAFFPTVWEWIKRWFDPITVSKIFILSQAQAYKTLSSFIDPEDIPQKYGGKLPFEFGGGPILEPHIAESLHWKNPEASWPKGPTRWQVNEDGVWTLQAVGSVDGVERREDLATFTPDPVPEPDVPDKAYDFATNTVMRSRSSIYVSQPPSPTASRHANPLNDASPKVATTSSATDHPEAQEKTDNAVTDDAAGATDDKANAAEASTVTATAATADAAIGDTAPVPPSPESAPKTGEVPLAATATPLPDSKVEEVKA